MYRFINQINVSITTNRTCTLRCDHCYIEKHLFNDRTQMTKETFKLIFDRIEELYAADHNLHEIEWECIGGETTMMPYEWWEEMLPYALARITKINEKLKVPGSLNFLTNLIYRDKRYTDLINKYGDHPYFCLYTSWEPDTNRFGKNAKKLPQFFETLKQVNVKTKILDIILTKEVCNLGAKHILDTFLPYGITDFSCKQLSPYGSGKDFFHPNMATFSEMTKFLMDMSDLKPDYVTFTPEEEMLSSLHRGTSFQCNGNFKYDLVIEPDGTCTFNASQTASDAALGYKTLLIDDPLWAQKVIFENTIEETRKLTLHHEECNDCEYLHYCNGGWYHYKIAPPSEIDRYKDGECSGFKALWDKERASLPVLHDRSMAYHKAAFKALVRPQRTFDGKMHSETEMAKGLGYNGFFGAIKAIGADGVCIDKQKNYGKTLLERCYFYDDVAIPFTIDSDILINAGDCEAVISAYLDKTFTHLIISNEIVHKAIDTLNGTELYKELSACKKAAMFIKEDRFPIDQFTPRLALDSRREEKIRWCYQNLSDLYYMQDMETTLTQDEATYLFKLQGHLKRERAAR